MEHFEIGRRLFIVLIWFICGVGGIATKDTSGNWVAIALMFTVLYGIMLALKF